MKNPHLENLLMQFVRDQETFSENNYKFITHTNNLDNSIQYLIKLKRDVESQFIACKSRLRDFRAQCDEAKRNQELVRVDLEKIDSETGEKIFYHETLPSDEAYLKFAAKEGRWKVKNMRFLTLIEGCILTLKHVRHLEFLAPVDQEPVTV